MTKSLNVWRVCYINEQKRIYLDGAPVQNRTIRLSILAAIDGNRLPLTGWIRKQNGTWEFDKQGPFKSYVEKNNEV